MEAQRDKWSSIQDPISHLNCFLSRVCDLREKSSAGRRFIFEFVSISENMLELKLHSGDHFLVTWFFLFVVWKWVKLFFPRNWIKSFLSVSWSFFFFSFQEILWTSEYNRIYKIFIFFRCLKSCGKISQELFFMWNWIKIYFPYKLREKSFKRNFFFKLVNFPKLIFSTKLIFFFLTKICNFLCHFLLFFWHVKNLHLEFFRRNFSCESQ